jgi:Skp family chaperone for outer membrane proteins
MSKGKTAIIIAITALFFCIFQYFKPNNQKIGYVFVEDVMGESYALQDINDKLKLEETTRLKNSNDFYNKIQIKAKWLRENNSKIKSNELIDKQHEIVDMERAYSLMQKKTYAQLDSIKVVWTTPVFDSINSFIKNYSNKNGYDYVLGNLGNGNIMYGKHTNDLTLKIIDALNVVYSKRNKP